MTVATENIGKARARCSYVCAALGKQVRDRRVQRGMSTDRAADLAGISWSAWRNVELGRSPSVLTWFKVAEVLEWELFIEMEEK